MGGTRVTIDAAVLASPVRIDAGLETDIRAVVVRDERAAVVFEEDCARQRIFLRVPISVGFELDFLEAIGRIIRCAAARIRTARHRGEYSALFQGRTVLRAPAVEP